MISTTRSASRPLPSPDTEDPRSLTTTVAPCLASSSAWARPMPWPAPVTIAVLPSNRAVMRASFGSGRRPEERPGELVGERLEVDGQRHADAQVRRLAADHGGHDPRALLEVDHRRDVR